MNKLFALGLLALILSAPAFAKDVVGHGAKVVGKDSAKVVSVTAKKSAKAVGAVGKCSRWWPSSKPARQRCCG